MSELRPIILILAGGAATRMGGADKALIMWKGERMIDRIYDRLSPQGQVVISGRQNYGKDCLFIPDDPQSRLKGPAAGLGAMSDWMKTNNLSQNGFYTVPVDGPNPPLDLVERLGNIEPTVAVDIDGHVQPTFAYWTHERLSDVLEGDNVGSSPSLKFLAQQCGARHVVWKDKDAFLNINSANDISQLSE